MLKANPVLKFLIYAWYNYINKTKVRLCKIQEVKIMDKDLYADLVHTINGFD